ncbi:MAG: hypothetical protein GF364_22410, partial [Candidatus Lokiarchaeota archaeon]|nr:hypothetical protein [Candidatus Lokiarchaeota archaeon]
MPREINGQLLIRLVCPICNKTKEMYIDTDKVKGSGKGLTTISISKGLVCEHSFRVFIDHNGEIRGYEKPDFELCIDVENEKDDEDKYLGDETTLEVIRSIFGDEILYKCIRTMIRGKKVFCISDNEYVQAHFGHLMENLFKEHTPIIEVSSLEDYNSRLRKIVFASKYSEAFVFNADLPKIIKQPYKPGYKDSNYK